MTKRDFSKLKRPIQSMPDFVRNSLEAHDLMIVFQNRPPYQQNDYLSWITRAKREATKEKRLAQMLMELEKGNVYMKMNYSPKDKQS